MVDHHVWCVVQLVARIGHAITELLVAAGDESVVEGADIIEELARDEQAGGRREAVFLDERRDREARQVVVATGERGVVRLDEAHVGGEVVRAAVVEIGERGLQPALRDGLVCVEEHEHVACCVLDAGIARGVRALDVALVEEMNVVVIGGILACDLRRVVGGAVVDDEDLWSGTRVREERLKGVAEAGGVVVDGNDDGCVRHD